MKKYKDLAKNIILFAIGNFVPKLISFVLVPIYTTFLSTDEYGISDLLNVTVSLFIPIVTFNITDAILRYSLDKKYNTKDCLNISLKLLSINLLLLLFLCIIQAKFNIININTGYLFYFYVMLSLNSLYNIFCAYCKGINKVKVILLASIVNSVSTFLISIITIIIFHQGIYGLFISNIAGYLFANLVFIFGAKLYKYFSRNYSRMQMRSMLKYSFPMIFSAIAWWVNSASDKYFITVIANVSESGIYAVSTKIPSILTSLLAIFMQAWSISAIKEFDREDKDGFISKMFNIISGLLCIACSLLIILNQPISKLMFSKDFFIAWKNVPFLLVAITLDGLALFICNLLFAMKKTKIRAIATIIGAVINTVLNIALIKIWSSYGASIATFFGYLVTYVISVLYIKRYIKFKQNTNKNNIAICLIILQSVFASTNNTYILIQIILLFALLLLYRSEIIRAYQVIIKKYLLKRDGKKIT